VSNVTIWYHDPAEVSIDSSWTGLAARLRGAARRDITSCQEPSVLKLFEYARPDAVVTVGVEPVVSIEQTMMNPSGHNIPQRFSCIAKAAELGIPGILYYPEASRRTYSDPNVRYLNVRVPLAQFRLMEIFDSLSLSVFWPTGDNKLPRTDQEAQRNLASVVDVIVGRAGAPLSASSLATETSIAEAMAEMDRVIRRYGVSRGYRPNPSVRALKPSGFAQTQRGASLPIDPPLVVELAKTDVFLSALLSGTSVGVDDPRLTQFRTRQLTLALRATANHNGTDSEHPWPGYLTLIDTLYAKEAGGKSRSNRTHNLVYKLPVPVDRFLSRLTNPPTATSIVDTVSDLVVLSDGIILGQCQRANPRSALLCRFRGRASDSGTQVTLDQETP
jgi:hypothetical protein